MSFAIAVAGAPPIKFQAGAADENYPRPLDLSGRYPAAAVAELIDRLWCRPPIWEARVAIGLGIAQLQPRRDIFRSNPAFTKFSEDGA
jgi:hypothetical protein